MSMDAASVTEAGTFRAGVRAWLDSLTQFSDKIPQLPDEAFVRRARL